jgi:hypothetical protein
LPDDVEIDNRLAGHSPVAKHRQFGLGQSDWQQLTGLELQVRIGLVLGKGGGAIVRCFFVRHLLYEHDLFGERIGELRRQRFRRGHDGAGHCEHRKQRSRTAHRGILARLVATVAGAADPVPPSQTKSASGRSRR